MGFHFRRTPDGFVGAVLNTMPIARSVVPLRVKNADQIWSEYINPELDLVWLGKQTAEAGMKKAADEIRKSGLLQGNW